jgi:hypothetical protein
MSFKSTLYAFYFQKPCRVYTGIFFSVGQFTHTSTLFFLKRQESVTKNTGQGEIIIQDLDVTTRLIHASVDLLDFGLEIQVYFS